MNTHRFTPAREGGKICDVYRDESGDGPCGLTASAPIHSVPPSAATVAMVDRFEAERIAGLAPTEARHELTVEMGILRRPGRGYQGKIESLTARIAAALVLLDDLRGNVKSPIIPIHDDRSYFRELIAEIKATLTAPAVPPAEACHRIGEVCATHGGRHITRCAATPAEERAGVSDRNAAALAAVADLRREVGRCVNSGAMGPGYRSHFDVIEQALRAGGVA